MEPTAPEHQHTSNNPETTVDKEAALTYALGIDQIADMRARQAEAFNQAWNRAQENGVSIDDAIVEGKQAARLVSDEYADSIVDTNFYDDDTAGRAKDIVQQYSFLTMSEHEWRLGKVDNEGNVERKSGRERLDEDAHDLLQSISSETSTPEAVDPYIEAERNTLDRLRAEVAKLSAKRQARLWGSGGDDYDEAFKAYNDQVIKLGKLEKKALIEDESASEITKKAEVVGYLFNEQNKLREASAENLKGTKVSKFIEWMNRGNVAQRIAKGVAIGAGASLVAGGVGAVVGIAGGAAIVGGLTAGIVGAGRFARGFARSDAKGGRGMQQLDDIRHLEDAQAVESDSDDHFDAIFAHFQENYEKDIDKEQAKRRRSVIAGLGGIALGTGLGATVAFIADAAPGIEGWLNRGPSLPFADHSAAAEAPPTDQDLGGGADSGASGETGVGDTGAETDGAPDAGAPDGETDSGKTFLPNADADATPDSTPEVVPTFDPNFVIDSGEGGIHFFQSLGLSEANWYEVHHELLQNFPNDFYPMGEGQVGLAHPGQLSMEAQQFIKARFSLP
jgi:hypothetical protein